jgi:hypothetical protein
MRRRGYPWRPLRRRLCAGLTLVAYLLTALGVPLPAVARKATDEPFPCQDHPCGCQTAEQCWRACCCFSPEERLAWARAHQVEPPEYAEPPTGGLSWRTTRVRDRAQGCCTGDPVCCTEPRDQPSCCQTKPAENERTAPQKPTRGGIRWALGVSALRCQMPGSQWAATGAVLPPSPPLTWSPWFAPIGWVAGSHEQLVSLPLIPPDPPPRPACA